MGGVLADGAAIDRWERLIREGDRDLMLREFFREVAGYGEDQIDELAVTPCGSGASGCRRPSRASCVPSWRSPSTGRRSATCHADSDAARKREPRLGGPLHDGYSEAIPNAEIRILEGHGHGANTSGPELLATEIARMRRPGTL